MTEGGHSRVPGQNWRKPRCCTAFSTVFIYICSVMARPRRSLKRLVGYQQYFSTVKKDAEKHYNDVIIMKKIPMKNCPHSFLVSKQNLPTQPFSCVKNVHTNNSQQCSCVKMEHTNNSQQFSCVKIEPTSER